MTFLSVEFGVVSTRQQSFLRRFQRSGMILAEALVPLADAGPATRRLKSSRKDISVISPTHGMTMPLNVRSEEVNQLAEKLAARKNINKTEAVKLALENELRRLDEALPLKERLRPLQRRILARPPTGLEADKAFYDDLSGEV